MTRYCVSPTTSGIVNSENSAEAETIPADSSVSRPYFVAIIVVNAATGELTAITVAVVIVASIFSMSITPITASGRTISLSAIAIYASLSFSTFRRSECIR